MIVDRVTHLEKMGLTTPGIWKDCSWCVYTGAHKTLQVVLSYRLYFGRRRPHAEELRAHAKAGGGVAAE